MNLFEYLNEYGQDSFEVRPFCEVDSLCLALVSYLPLADFLDASFPQEYSLQQLCGLYLIYETECEAAYNRRFAKQNTRFFRQLGKSARFSSLRVTDFCDRRDKESQMQFAALTVKAPAFSFVSFRGTDDTLVGWKEDFNLSFLSATPSQLAAAEYAKKIAAHTEGELYFGGHSKGGNLAVFAAANLAETARVAGVFSHDAPGFLPDFLASQGYHSVADKCVFFVPQTSVIGLLLENAQTPVVIHSATHGLLQHDPYSWQVTGEAFVRHETLNRQSRYIDRTLSLWLSEMDAGHREVFVDAVYELILATDAENVGELAQKMARSLTAIKERHAQMDEDTRRILKSTMERLFSLAWETLRLESGMKEKEQEFRRALEENLIPLREKIGALWEEGSQKLKKIKPQKDK